MFGELVEKASARVVAEEGRVEALMERHHAELLQRASTAFWKAGTLPERSDFTVSLTSIHRALGVNTLFCKDKNSDGYAKVFLATLRKWLGAYGLDVLSYDGWRILRVGEGWQHLPKVLTRLKRGPQQTWELPIPFEASRPVSQVSLSAASLYTLALYESCPEIQDDSLSLRELIELPLLIFLERAMIRESLLPKEILKREIAKGLVWQVSEHQPTRHWIARVAEDGSLADSEDNPVRLSPTSQLRVAHPVYMSPKEIVGWQNILSDYGIIQPFRQLSRPTFRRTSESRDAWLKGLVGEAIPTQFPGWGCGIAWGAGCVADTPDMLSVGGLYIKLRSYQGDTLDGVYAPHHTMGLVMWSETERAIQAWFSSELHGDLGIDGLVEGYEY